MALASALTLAVSGCSRDRGPSVRDPLGGGAFGSISDDDDCAPGHVNQPQTFGDERFTNNGQSAVVIDRVVLLHPHSERLVGSYAMPGNSFIRATGHLSTLAFRPHGSATSQRVISIWRPASRLIWCSALQQLPSTALDRTEF